MVKRVIQIRLSVVVALAVVAVVGLVAGVTLPAAQPAAAPVVLGSSQALTNSFRNVAIKPADNTIPLSITQYTTPTKDAFVIYSPSGAELFKIDHAGGVTADVLTVTTLISQAIDINNTGNLTITGAFVGDSATLTGTATANGFSGTYLTGTLGTANQPNVTNLGTQTYLTATNGTITHLSATGASATYLTGTLGTANQPNVTNLGTQTYLTATNFSLNGAAVSGAWKWGTAASYDSGASIVHGFTTTPTMCILQPTRDVTSALTITATGFSSDMATVAEPIYWMCGQ